MLYSLDDITLIPGVLSPVSSRSECQPTYGGGRLPLIASPMSCVINEDNVETFEKAGITTILPRSVPLNNRLEYANSQFIAMGVNELEKFITDVDHAVIEASGAYICLDIAQGHMLKALSLITKAKSINNLFIMAGNIANPQTYIEYAHAGVDFVRIGIGTGSVCSTSMGCGMHYPMGSLIIEINKIREQFGFGPKIVADGGFHTNDQIIKALALGADYCMLGEIFAKTEESCGRVVQRDEKNFYKEYYGMSTKKAQKEFGKDGKKYEEGFYKTVKVEYTLQEWINRFKHDLSDAMSYAGVFVLNDFIGNIQYDIMSPNARRAYYKEMLL